MTSSDRFFPATILGVHLHVRGIPDWGPWDSSRLERQTEAFVDMVLSKITGDRKVGTREELEAAMKEPMGPSPTRYLWMHESLVDDACWEKMTSDLYRLGLSLPQDVQPHGRTHHDMSGPGVPLYHLQAAEGCPRQNAFLPNGFEEPLEEGDVLEVVTEQERFGSLQQKDASPKDLFHRPDCGTMFAQIFWVMARTPWRRSRRSDVQ